jgi:hypothetical protein
LQQTRAVLGEQRLAGGAARRRHVGEDDAAVGPFASKASTSGSAARVSPTETACTQMVSGAGAAWRG